MRGIQPVLTISLYDGESGQLFEGNSLSCNLLNAYLVDVLTLTSLACRSKHGLINRKSHAKDGRTEYLLPTTLTRCAVPKL